MSTELRVTGGDFEWVKNRFLHSISQGEGLKIIFVENENFFSVVHLTTI